MSKLTERRLKTTIETGLPILGATAAALAPAIAVVEAAPTEARDQVPDQEGLRWGGEPTVHENVTDAAEMIQFILNETSAGGTEIHLAPGATLNWPAESQGVTFDKPVYIYGDSVNPATINGLGSEASETLFHATGSILDLRHITWQNHGTWSEETGYTLDRDAFFNFIGDQLYMHDIKVKNMATDNIILDIRAVNTLQITNCEFDGLRSHSGVIGIASPAEQLEGQIAHVTVSNVINDKANSNVKGIALDIITLRGELFVYDLQVSNSQGDYSIISPVAAGAEMWVVGGTLPGSKGAAYISGDIEYHGWPDQNHIVEQVGDATANIEAPSPLTAATATLEDDVIPPETTPSLTVELQSAIEDEVTAPVTIEAVIYDAEGEVVATKIITHSLDQGLNAPEMTTLDFADVLPNGLTGYGSYSIETTVTQGIGEHANEVLLGTQEFEVGAGITTVNIGIEDQTLPIGEDLFVELEILGEEGRTATGPFDVKIVDGQGKTIYEDTIYVELDRTNLLPIMIPAENLPNKATNLTISAQVSAPATLSPVSSRPVTVELGREIGVVTAEPQAADYTTGTQRFPIVTTGGILDLKVGLTGVLTPTIPEEGIDFTIGWGDGITTTHTVHSLSEIITHTFEITADETQNRVISITAANPFGEDEIPVQAEVPYQYQPKEEDPQGFDYRAFFPLVLRH